MLTVRVNNVRLYYETHGSGPALVLIAGLNSDHTLFRSFISRLAERYQVIVFDNRGIGQSLSHGCRRSADQRATGVAAQAEEE